MDWYSDLKTRFPNLYTNVRIRGQSGCIVNISKSTDPRLLRFNTQISGYPVMFLLSDDGRFNGYNIGSEYLRGYKNSYVLHTQMSYNAVIKMLDVIGSLNKNIKVL